jgi:hypothetical protein
MKHIKSYTVILLMPYLYENGTAEAWQKLMEELGPMGYSVQDEESLELHSTLASEVRIILTVSFNPLNAEINPICHLLALLGGATIVDVSRLRVNIL